MKPRENLMVELETMGMGSCAAIVAIGAVFLIQRQVKQALPFIKLSISLHQCLPVVPSMAKL